MNYEVLVLGSGPAGFEAAVKLAEGGLSTAIVTATPPGGRATVGSLLPSKVWLHHANHSEAGGARDIPATAAEVRATITGRVAYTRSTLEAAGVTIVSGHATLTGPHAVEVRSGEGSATELKEITADFIVLANGSEPIFFPGVKPDGTRIIAPRHTQHLQELPESLVMIGGGVTGVEYSSVFARLGTRVQMLSYDPLLPRSDREYTGRLESMLRDLGVAIETGVAVSAVENLGDRVRVTREDGSDMEADYAFIATGRAGDLTFLDQRSPDLRTTADGRFLAVDRQGRSSEPSIFACGDLTGPPLTANTAVLEARRVVAAVLGTAAPAEDTPVIEAVYTQPQLAQVGPVLQLHDRSDLRVVRKSYATSMLGQVHGSADGEIKVWVDASDRIHGAAAWGEAASEVLAPVQVAMQTGNTWGALSAVPFAYPSLTEVVTA
jgi:dihydrolipoamide dehydrogenase